MLHNSHMERQQTQPIVKDLKKKIVFLVGPRQVGKTYLAKQIGERFKHTVYLNYDRREDRQIIKREGWLSTTELLILDELHKMPKWKNYLKGVFDTKPPRLQILVTGSARLDFLRHAGDSLAGRYFVHRLLPLTPSELSAVKQPVDLERLLERGGFPEPYLAEELVEAERWRQQYLDGLIRTDVLDFERIHDFRALQEVLELLRLRVGSPISYRSLAEDIQVAPNTVKKYIHILEALYIVFRVTPYTQSISRTLLKNPKLYFFDTALVRGDDGARWENFVALSLLKHTYGRADATGRDYSLHFIRTKEGKEVDFCLTVDKKPLALLEAKYGENDISRPLVQFGQTLRVPAAQVVKELKREQKFEGGKVLLLRAENLAEIFRAE